MSLRAAAFAPLLLAALLLCAAPAMAQTEGESPDASVGAAADISGSWAFKTAPYRFVCTMNGQITLTPTSDPDVYEGRLVAFELCAGGQRYEAHQSAIAVRSGDRLIVTSTLERVLPFPDFYQPDDFELSIVNGGLMIGELHSAGISARAEFRRSDGPIS